VSRTIGADTLYFLYNGHADVTSLIKSDATIVASYYYDAFGTITSHKDRSEGTVLLLLFFFHGKIKEKTEGVI